MKPWKIEAVGIRTEDNVITQAHWRYGNAYGSENVESAGLVAGVADEAAVVAAVKATLGAEKIEQIETRESDAELEQSFPDIRTTTLAKAAAVVAENADAKLDRIAAQRMSLDKREAFIESKQTLEKAQADRANALAARDAAVQARADSVTALEAAQAARAAAVKARDDAITAGTTGAPLQALRDALTAATSARDAAVAARNAATTDVAAKNSALDAATTALATARTNHQALRTA